MPVPSLRAAAASVGAVGLAVALSVSTACAPRAAQPSQTSSFSDSVAASSSVSGQPTRSAEATHTSGQATTTATGQTSSSMTESAWAFIYENRGVGAARLGDTEASAVAKLGSPSASANVGTYLGTGTSASAKYFGEKSSGRYALEMYSTGVGKKRRVVAFVINAPPYVTKAAITVGSHQMSLTGAYGSTLKGPFKQPGGAYYSYQLRSRSGRTDFYLGKDDTVTYITVTK
jgi:hypothetical protein